MQFCPFVKIGTDDILLALADTASFKEMNILFE